MIKKALFILVMLLTVTLASCDTVFDSYETYEYELVSLEDNKEIEANGRFYIIAWYNEKTVLNYAMYLKYNETGAVYYVELGEYDIKHDTEIYFIEESVTPYVLIRMPSNSDGRPSNNYDFQIYIHENSIAYNIKLG